MEGSRLPNCFPAIYQYCIPCHCCGSSSAGSASDMAEGMYRQRSVSFPGTSLTDFDHQPASSAARRRAHTEINIKDPIVRNKRPGINDRRRSLSDPPNRVSKFFNWGFGYLATLTNLTKTTPKIHSERGTYDDIPPKNIAPIKTHVLAAYSGPSGGLSNILEDIESGKVYDVSEREIRLGTQGTKSSGEESTVSNEDIQVSSNNSSNTCNNESYTRQSSEAARIADWNLRKDWAYGIAVSLYECQSDVIKECTGEPIADVVAIRATENSAILGVADGCGWGYGSRRAARCAMKGCMEYIAKHLYSPFIEKEEAVTNTTEIFRIMRASVDEGQRLVIASTATLTTLVLSVVTQIANSKDFVVCTMAIGDSLAYVFSEAHGVRELTAGNREYTNHRNIRFCDGALGPAMGESPDLTNMTFSMSVVKRGDVVFLTSDGVSDNFDPVIAGQAEASPEFNSTGSFVPDHTKEDPDPESELYRNCKPVFSPHDRQEQAEYQLDEILTKTDIPDDNLCSANAVCAKLLDYTTVSTQTKRKAQQSYNTVMIDRAKNPDHITDDDDHPDNTPEGLRQFVRSLPGKLDHASVVAYVVGMHRGMHGIEEEREPEGEEEKEPNGNEVTENDNKEKKMNKREEAEEVFQSEAEVVKMGLEKDSTFSTEVPSDRGNIN